MSFVSITITLFLIMNSAGSIESFLGLISKVDQRRQNWILFREMLFALALMTVFHFFGEFLLSFIGIAHTTVQIAGGLILFLIAIKMILASSHSPVMGLSQGEPFIVPIATPMIAGPSILTTIMLYAYYEENTLKVLLAILIAWFATMGVFILAIRFKDRISDKFVNALERLMGLILTMMAVEMLLEGIKLFIQTKGAS